MPSLKPRLPPLACAALAFSLSLFALKYMSQYVLHRHGFMRVCNKVCRGPQEPPTAKGAVGNGTLVHVFTEGSTSAEINQKANPNYEFRFYSTRGAGSYVEEHCPLVHSAYQAALPQAYM